MGAAEQEYNDKVTALCRACSDPVFISDYFLKDGHSEKTSNATVTFVKCEGRHYACTCEHVATADELKIDRRTLGLRAGRVIINLSWFHANGLQTAFRNPPGIIEGDKVDVAIADISSSWAILEEQKNKVAVDLDRWREPPWESIEYCAAAGYPNHHKEREGEMVASLMPVATAALGAPLSRDARQFTLTSALEEPHGIYFSGMSGGPIVGCLEKGPVPIGLIFEGMPSSPDAPASIYAGPNDIFIRGLLLRPQIFGAWLATAELL